MQDELRKLYRSAVEIKKKVVFKDGSGSPFMGQNVTAGLIPSHDGLQLLTSTAMCCDLKIQGAKIHTGSTVL